MARGNCEQISPRPRRTQTCFQRNCESFLARLSAVAVLLLATLHVTSLPSPPCVEIVLLVFVSGKIIPSQSQLKSAAPKRDLAFPSVVILSQQFCCSLLLPLISEHEIPYFDIDELANDLISVFSFSTEIGSVIQDATVDIAVPLMSLSLLITVEL